MGTRKEKNYENVGKYHCGRVENVKTLNYLSLLKLEILILMAK
jgi:hypothetical protein